jgi:acyl-CoA synthetase (AMP-forming)/AMP-acid ligase II
VTSEHDVTQDLVMRPAVPAEKLAPLDARLGDVLRRLRAERPQAVAFETPTRRWTFAEADAAANRIAQGLRSLGIGAGQRVACLTRHGAECTLLLLAAARLGAVCAPLNWRLAGPEVEYVLNHSEARFLLVDAEFMPALEGRRFDRLVLTARTDGAAPGQPHFADWLAGFDATDPHADGAPEDAALQLYSSGTTGLPKGIEMSSRNLLLACTAYAQVCRIDAETVMLNALPAFHIAGVENALTTLIEGGRTIFHPAFDPQATIQTIQRDRITHIFLVPAMMLFVLQHPTAAEADFSSLRMVSYGGSPIAESLLAQAQARFGCGLLQTYGMTEATGPITWLLPEDHDPGGPRAHLLRSAGTPSPGVEVRVVDPTTGHDCADGAVGEVWMRSPQSMIGYWRNPEGTRAAFPEGRDAQGGWLRTGDAGYRRDGVLYIHDRLKDMIISGGENIYPAEIENVLAAHPDLAEVAVIGVPDARWGEAVKACVVPRPGREPDPAEVIAWVRERLAHYKCPKTVDVVATLPRNPSGKLLKRVLREPYWKDSERQVG